MNVHLYAYFPLLYNKHQEQERPLRYPFCIKSKLDEATVLVKINNSLELSVPLSPLHCPAASTLRHPKLVDRGCHLTEISTAADYCLVLGGLALGGDSPWWVGNYG